ncbi:TIGR03862 family flavoprotein [uncultured Brevundimonas sp.]|uniref:TIGR03862 family flavoprotein n=1 Tax=uncultured Brevundimonas sp. TaxID=213418 RepID=UPI002623BE64|nr:TIGR03862 family flavoprotein [uncultured Brevundimonas sp.]
MNATSPLTTTVAVIGAGPAGLMAAEQLAQSGYQVTVYDQMPSVARKFLMAGRGGLNLTHSEPRPRFDGRYGALESRVATWLDRFDAEALRQWADSLGAEIFVGSSGRVFPKAMKASPLLRAWLGRLDQLGVAVRTRSRWTGWDGDSLTIETPDGAEQITADAVVLAMGGASWARLGSDAAWVPWLKAKGVEVETFRPSNVGFEAKWSPVLAEKYAGQPLKNIAVSHKESHARGEAMVAQYGLEGGAVYALSSAIREDIAANGAATIHIDLRPDLDHQTLVTRLSKPQGKNSLSNHLRKALKLDGVAVALMREGGPLPHDIDELARLIKAVPVTLNAPRGLDRAISSAGGISASQYGPDMMLTALPGVFVCGEMLDWEAPTGGYLLQACFASAVVAADGVAAYLEGRAGQ